MTNGPSITELAKTSYQPQTLGQGFRFNLTTWTIKYYSDSHMSTQVATNHVQPD